jgi:hypothetical protein
MVVHLHRVSVCLESEAAVVQQCWQRLFAGWLGADSSAVQARLQLSLVEELPALPDLSPFFVDAAGLRDGVRLLAVYGWEGGVLLDYWGGARVQVPLAGGDPFVRGEVLPQALAYGRLEDITFTSLAPCLRRHDFFLVHAFGAARGDRCVLVVGPSGSGKTTTGLSLVLAGWELLANDILLIELRPDGVYALPTPGGLSIREETLRLLPDCRSLVSDAAWAQGKYELTNQQVLYGRRPDPRRVSAIYFCQVEERERAEIRPLSQAMALARLMEQSVDRWDEAMLDRHVGVLQELSQQVEAYSLRLGGDVWRLPELLGGGGRGE